MIPEPSSHFFSKSRGIQLLVTTLVTTVAVSTFQGLDEALVVLFLLSVTMMQTLLIPFASRRRDSHMRIFILTVLESKAPFTSTFADVLVSSIDEFGSSNEKFPFRLFLLFLQLLLMLLLRDFRRLHLLVYI